MRKYIVRETAFTNREKLCEETAKQLGDIKTGKTSIDTSSPSSFNKYKALCRYDLTGTCRDGDKCLMTHGAGPKTVKAAMKKTGISALPVYPSSADQNGATKGRQAMH